MPKLPSIEQSLSQLNALRGMGAAVANELQKFLVSKTNLIAAKAADLIREANLKSLEPQLAEAFNRFMQNPSTTDKGCAAKQAIVNTLYELGCDAQDVFLVGIRHVQKEGAWGKPVDTAAELRGLCALGLVRMAYRDVMSELVDLLVDPEPVAAAAIEALGIYHHVESVGARMRETIKARASQRLNVQFEKVFGVPH
jgi:hypothetical protein